MKIRTLGRLAAAVMVTGVLAGGWLPALAADEAPDAMMKRLSDEVLGTIKSDKLVQSGDISRIMQVVDSKIMPNVNFARMTSSAVGPAWRDASPEQRKRLQDEFKLLLVRTYSGALTQVSNQTIQVKPMRGSADDNEVVVKTEVRGQGDPIQLDYRLEKAGDSWKVYDINVAGVWLVQNYQNSFAQEIGANGIDGLISKLAERNKSAAAAKS